VLAFAVAVFLLIITPGPGVLSAAGVGSAYGRKTGLSYVAGLFVGSNLVALAVVSGVATIVFSVPYVRQILLLLSAIYLLYLAYRIAFAGSRIAFTNPRVRPRFFSGITLQAINPKAYAVNTTLFTGFAFMPGAVATETLIKFAILNAIWVPIHLLWLWAGISINQLELSQTQQSRINMAMAAAMVLVVALALFSLR